MGPIGLMGLMGCCGWWMGWVVGALGGRAAPMAAWADRAGQARREHRDNSEGGASDVLGSRSESAGVEGVFEVWGGEAVSGVLFVLSAGEAAGDV